MKTTIKQQISDSIKRLKPMHDDNRDYFLCLYGLWLRGVYRLAGNYFKSTLSEANQKNVFRLWGKKK